MKPVSSRGETRGAVNTENCSRIAAQVSSLDQARQNMANSEGVPRGLPRHSPTPSALLEILPLVKTRVGTLLQFAKTSVLTAPRTPADAHQSFQPLTHNATSLVNSVVWSRRYTTKAPSFRGGRIRGAQVQLFLHLTNSGSGGTVIASSAVAFASVRAAFPACNQQSINPDKRKTREEMRPIKHVEKCLTLVAGAVHSTIQSVNKYKPNPSFTPKWSDKPLLKSWQKSKPTLGWPRTTDSLCPNCVIEARESILSGKQDVSVLINEKVGEIKAQIIERDGETLDGERLCDPWTL